MLKMFKTMSDMENGKWAKFFSFSQYGKLHDQKLHDQEKLQNKELYCASDTKLAKELLETISF